MEGEETPRRELNLVRNLHAVRYEVLPIVETNFGVI